MREAIDCNRIKKVVERQAGEWAVEGQGERGKGKVEGQRGDRGKEGKGG